MLQIKSGAVIFAKEILRVAEFYRDVLGMPILVAEKDHIILESATFQLVIHGIPKKIAAQIQIQAPPSLREDTALKLFFPVESIAQARLKAKALGGALKPKSSEWEARGFRACDGHDPEGNVLQVRELAS